MVDWLSQWQAFLGVGVVVFVPGLLAGLAFRMRGLALWALAPVLSTAIVALVALVLPFTGVSWSALSATAGALILVGLAWALALLLGRPGPKRLTHSGPRWIIGAGLGVAVVLAALRLGLYIGAPRNISQTNDAIFHLGVLRFISETGSASSLDVSGVLGGTAFYPAAWHALASYAAMISGSDTAVVVNALSLVLAAVVWPLGIAWFTACSTRSVSTTGIAAALSPLMLTFPYLMFQWGVVYPYALALSLLPAAAGVMLSASTWRDRDSHLGWRSIVGVALVASAAVGALALAQPSVIVAWLIIVASFALWTIGRLWRGSSATRRGWLAGWAAAVIVAFAAGWILLARGTSGSTWDVYRPKWLAAADVLFNGQVMLPHLWGMSILALAGVVVAVVTPRLRWLATVWAVFSGLYVVAASFAQPTLRDWLIGAWYGDPYRIAALAPIAVVPLAAVGLAWIASWGARALAPDSGRDGSRVAVGAVAALGAVMLIVAPIVQMPRVYSGTVEQETRYAISDTSFLSLDERALLERLDESMPPGAIAIGHPSTGAAFGYALSDRDVYPRTWAPPRTPEFTLLSQQLNNAANDPLVCDALSDIGAEYVLDFGPGETTPGRYLFPAMTGFADHDGFELVDSQGDASLWRVTACD